MKKYYTLEKFPKVLIVEGFWRVGKSRLIAQILRTRKINHISEPNHIKAGVSKNISRWYRSQHNQGLKFAIKHLKNGKSTILERSILSSLAFYYAKYAKVPAWFNQSISRLQKLSNLRVLFLHGDKKINFRDALSMQDNTVRTLILKDSKFYDRYISFYTSILPSLTQINIAHIRAPGNSGSALKKVAKKVYNLLSPDSLVQQKYKKKKKDLCASVVLFYKKKFLVLYSRDYRYYVLPQGHKVAPENYTDTALRETREETGFYNLEIIAPLGKYSYRYSKNNILIDKHIRVYLIRLKTLARRKKRLEPHEHYSNHFFTADEAINKLRWPEDKKMIRRSEKIISKIKKES